MYRDYPRGMAISTGILNVPARNHCVATPQREQLTDVRQGVCWHWDIQRSPGRCMSALNIVHRTSTFKLIKKNKTKLNRIHGIKKIKSNSRDKKHFLLDNTDLKSIAFVQKIGYILNHKTKVIPFCIIWNDSESIHTAVKNITLSP